VYELLRLNSRELVDAGIDLDAAEEYCSWIQGELHRESGTEWINEAIIDFQQEVQSAR
jgi:hypothetical protein